MDRTLDSEKTSQSVKAPTEHFTPPAFRDTAALLRTAVPYMDEDRALAEANISYPQFKGALLDQEISRLRKSLDKVEQRRSIARKFEEMERGLLSPIRKLPLDVLQHIFMLVNQGVFLSQKIIAFPRTASQVCSYWRAAAHSCAPLWQEVVCIFIQPVKVYDPKYGILLEDCVKYSRNMPMSFPLICGATPEVLGDIGVQALIRCAHRWKKLIIEGDLATAVFSSIPKDTTMEYLETLNIQYVNNTLSIRSAPRLRQLTITGDDRNDIDPRGSVGIESAPSLVELTLERYHLPSMTLEGVDWSRITHFKVAEMAFEPDALITILQRMTRLVSLTIHGETGGIGSIVMPHLEEIKTGERDQVQTNIFDCLTAPRLKKLEVEWDTEWLSFVQFAARSGCKIEELKLTGTWIDDSFQSPAFASVKTLIWEDPFSVGSSIKKLMYGSDFSADDIFPGLETLHITQLNGSPIEIDSWSVADLIDMLSSRLRPQETDISARKYLKSARVKFDCLAHENVTSLTNFINSELAKRSGVQIDIFSGNFHLLTSK